MSFLKRYFYAAILGASLGVNVELYRIATKANQVAHGVLADTERCLDGWKACQAGVPACGLEP